MTQLTPGTKVVGSSDPRTVEQNQAIAKIQTPDSSAIDKKYGGFLMTPTGQLTTDLSILNISDARKEEVAKMLATKGVVMMLNAEGQIVQYYGTADPAVVPVERELPEPAPIPTPPALKPVAVVQSVDIKNIIRISQNQFKKLYRQDSMKALPVDSITFENISTGFDVTVTIEQSDTYATDFSVFSLSPKSRKDVQIQYNIEQVNKLPEGILKIFPTIHYEALPVYVPPPTPPAATTIVPKVATPVVKLEEVIVKELPVLPPIEDSVPIFKAPEIIPAGRWVLTKISDESVSTENIIEMVADENGQLPGERNNWIGGVYHTVFGKTKTTRIPTLYDYVLEGDIRGAGQKPPTPENPSTVTYSDVDIIENRLLYQRPPDVRETEALAQQMGVPIPTPQVLVEQVQIDPVVAEPVQEPVQTSSGGGGGGSRSKFDTQLYDNEQISFYRDLSTQIEYAE